MWQFGNFCCCGPPDPPGPPQITPCGSCDAVYQCYDITPTIASTTGPCCSLYNGTFSIEHTGTACNFESQERAPIIIAGACSGSANFPRFAATLNMAGGAPLWTVFVYWFTRYFPGGVPTDVRHRYVFTNPGGAVGSCLDARTVTYGSKNLNLNGTYQPPPPPEPCGIFTGDTISIVGAFCEGNAEAGAFALSGNAVTLTHNT